MKWTSESMKTCAFAPPLHGTCKPVCSTAGKDGNSEWARFLLDPEGRLQPPIGTGSVHHVVVSATFADLEMASTPKVAPAINPCATHASRSLKGSNLPPCERDWTKQFHHGPKTSCRTLLTLRCVAEHNNAHLMQLFQASRQIIRWFTFSVPPRNEWNTTLGLSGVVLDREQPHATHVCVLSSLPHD